MDLDKEMAHSAALCIRKLLGVKALPQFPFFLKHFKL
jgi:hypothetical protein